MPFYVLVEIDSEEDAKEYAKRVLSEGGVLTSRVVVDSSTPVGIDVRYPVLCGKLRGVWRKPSIFCNPSDGHRAGRKTFQGWARSKKYGWWVCSGCGKPTKKWAAGDQWFHTLGANLVPQAITGEKRPKGWEKSPAEWDFLEQIVDEYEERKKE